MSPHRNSPCPCGSGRKFKRCCKQASNLVPRPADQSRGGTPDASSRKPLGPTIHPAWILKVSLAHIEPVIWRRIAVDPRSTLFELHELIQSLGWDDCHLWAFRNAETGKPLGELQKGRPQQLHPFGRQPAPNAKKVAVAQCFEYTGDEILYEYDFGDGWVHRICLEAELEFSDPFYATVLGGEHPLPPEDCGGPPGYARLQAYWRDGKDPHGDAEYEEWASCFSKTCFHASDLPNSYTPLSDANQAKVNALMTVKVVAPEGRAKIMTRELFLELQQRLAKTIREFDKEHGVATSLERGRFSVYGGQMTVESAVVSGDGVVMDRAAVTYLERAETVDLDPEWLGKVFHCGPDLVRIIGMNPRLKDPILLKTVPTDGTRSQTFKMHPARVLSFFTAGTAPS